MIYPDTAPVVEGPQAALDYLTALFQRSRPAEEVLAALDKYSDLFPEVLSTRSERPSPLVTWAPRRMHWRIAMAPDDRMTR